MITIRISIAENDFEILKMTPDEAQRTAQILLKNANEVKNKKDIKSIELATTLNDYARTIKVLKK